MRAAGIRQILLVWLTLISHNALITVAFSTIGTGYRTHYQTRALPLNLKQWPKIADRLLRRTSPLTTTNFPDDGGPKIGIIKKAKEKFVARPGTYLMIPVIAAIVGWVTNYLAVQMIFYPVEFRGIPIYRRAEIPLGFLGWQGIVPCKTKTMSIAMCDMVTSQLLTVSEAFHRLNPVELAKLLAPRVPALGVEITSEVFPQSLPSWPLRFLGRFADGQQPAILRYINVHFLTQMIRDMQSNIDSIFSLQNCVVDQMVNDRAKLGGEYSGRRGFLSSAIFRPAASYPH